MVPTSLPWSEPKKLRIYSRLDNNRLDKDERETRSRLIPCPKSGRKRRMMAPYYWGLGVIMLVWDWKISLATGLGIGAVWVLPAIQRYPWQPFLQKLLQQLQPLWIHTNRKFTFSLIGGGLVAMLSYVSLQIWSETQNHWLATWVLIQGVAVVLLVIVAVITLLQQSSNPSHSWNSAQGSGVDIHSYLRELTHGEPMNRLIAIHTLIRYLQQGKLERPVLDLIQDCLTLRLSQESDLTVQAAILKGLQQIRI